MKSLNINLFTARLILVAAFLMNSTASMAGTIGIWNDADKNLKVTLTKTKGSDSLSKKLIEAGKSIEIEDPNTQSESKFKKIIVYDENGKELRSWNFGDKWDESSVAFRLWKGEEKGKPAYFTSKPYKTLSQLRNGELEKAVSEGNVKEVKKFIESKVADVNNKNSFGQTVLFAAAAIGHLPIVQALITAGADVNATNAQGETALFSAVRNEHLAVVKELIKAGANVNQQAKFNYVYGTSLETVLMEAARKGNLAIVQELIKAKADINITDSFGATALFFATMPYNLPIVQELLKAGADINMRDIGGQTALFYAAKNLSEYGRRTSNGDYEPNGLLVTEALIKAGIDVNAKNKNGETVFDKYGKEMSAALVAIKKQEKK